MYTLYYAPDNASLVVRMVLQELGLAFQTHLVNRRESEQHSPAYRAMNPQGQIPVLLSPEQDEPLFETAACILYLAQRHPDSDFPLWPADVRAQGRALKWLFFLSNTVHAELKPVFYSARFLAKPETEVCDNLRHGLQSRLLAHLRLLDAQLATQAQRAQGQARAPTKLAGWELGTILQANAFEEGPMYLLGPRAYSVCDIYLAVCVRWALLYPVGKALKPDILEEMPYLWALLKHLEGRPALLKAAADEGLIEMHHSSAKLFTAPQLPHNLEAATG